jgi:hypothetical protein
MFHAKVSTPNITRRYLWSGREGRGGGTLSLFSALFWGQAEKKSKNQTKVFSFGMKLPLF